MEPNLSTLLFRAFGVKAGDAAGLATGVVAVPVAGVDAAGTWEDANEPTSQRAWEDAPGWKTLGLFWSFVSSDCSFPSTKSASPNQIKDPQNIWVSVVPNYTIGGKLQTCCKSCKWALKRSYDGMPLAVEVVVYVDSSWP